MSNRASIPTFLLNGPARPQGSGANRSAKRILVRLETMPATTGNRARILKRVQRVNREFRESGIPFRWRLL